MVVHLTVKDKDWGKRKFLQYLSIFEFVYFGTKLYLNCLNCQNYRNSWWMIKIKSENKFFNPCFMPFDRFIEAEIFILLMLLIVCRMLQFLELFWRILILPSPTNYIIAIWIVLVGWTIIVIVITGSNTLKNISLKFFFLQSFVQQI